MKYSIERIFLNLRKHCVIYLIIMANFMLGAGFFVLCMNFESTSRELLQESKRLSAEGEFQVQFYGIPSQEKLEKWKDYPVSYATYRKLLANEQYEKELEMLFSLDFHSHRFIVQPQTFLYTHIYFMNENLFTRLYGFAQTKGKAYLGESAYRTLLDAQEALETGGKDNVIYLDIPLFLENDQISIDGRLYPFEVAIPAEEQTIMPDRMGKTGYNMTDAVILPIEDYVVPVSSIPNETVGLRNIIFLRYRDDEWHEDVVAQLLRELNTACGLYTFKVDNDYLELKREMEDYSYDMDRWMFLSVSIMILSGIGCIGATFLFLNERRHFLAVSVAYGSTLGQITVETLMEVLSVFLSGGTLGILISPILKKMLVYTGELKVNIAGIGMVMLAAFLFSLLSVLLGMHAVKIKSVAVTLKDE